MDVLVGSNKPEFQEFSVKTEPVSIDLLRKISYIISFVVNYFVYQILIRLNSMHSNKIDGCEHIWFL